MKKAMVVVAVALAAAVGRSEGVEADGGIVKLGGKGHLAVVDCQSGIDWKAMDKTFQNFDESFHIDVVRKSGAPFELTKAADAVRKSGANAVLFVGDVKDYPMSLAAPEEKWAFINLAPLKKAGTNYLVRCRYHLMRGMCRALGSDVSRAKGTCLMPVYSPADLDKIEDFGMAMDTFIAISEACEVMGIEAPVYLTFREACELENPPTPTNDLQRAIAAEVKAALQKQKK